MKTVIISQARMTSTRLPGKILKEVLNKPLLAYQIERLQNAKAADELIIATTNNITDDPIVNLCNEMGISFYRGSEDDVLSRYYQAALEHQADIIVRVTSDCPIIDPNIVDRVINYFKDNMSNYDFISNALKRTYPRGMDTAVFPMTILSEAYHNAEEKSDREHVTSFIYHRPEKYRLGIVENDRDLSEYRWTLDTIEDYELISRIIAALYPQKPMFTMQDCLELLELHPDWMKINADVKQKIVGE